MILPTFPPSLTGEPASGQPEVLPHGSLARSLKNGERKGEIRTRPRRPKVSSIRESGVGVGGRARLAGDARCPGSRGGAKGSEAEPQMTEGGTQREPVRAGQDLVVVAPKLAVHGVQ